jgi:hypothetical protein
MSDDNQLAIPPSFIALFIEPRRPGKPTQPRTLIAEQYEFCEDLATLLVDHAQAQRCDSEIDQNAVLQRIHHGLLAGEPAALDAPRARWVVTRLAELLGWPELPLEAPPA